MTKDISIIAEEILHQSRNALCSHIHSLVLGTSRLCFAPVDKYNAFTDGSSFFYNPENICKRFLNDKNSVNRLVLHSLLHCVLLHPFNTAFKDKELWNLSCDISVECAINKWNISCTQSQKSKAQENFIKQYLCLEKNLTAENVYYSLLGMNKQEVLWGAELFADDNHNAWYNRVNGAFAESSDDTQLIELHSIYKRADETGGNTVSGKEETFTQTVNSSAEDEQKAWREIASHIAKESQSAKHLGYTSGTDVQLFEAVSRKKYDYGTILKKLLAVNETMEINDDEFDYIFYTYGLKLYDNMPIIEPLEYAENNKIKKLFIAIDTSGSVKGDIVRGFMEKTYGILKSADYFFNKCEIHILQCDSQIQDVCVVHNEQELENYIENVSLKGFGGTDFRPVFQYVNDICRNSGYGEVNGLIYFTDGDGVYPADMPKFKTLFAIYDNGFDKTRLPVWGTAVYIDKLDLIR